MKSLKISKAITKDLLKEKTIWIAAAAIVIVIIVVALIVGHSSNKTVPATDTKQNQKQAQLKAKQLACENSPQAQLYQQVLSEEKTKPASKSALASTAASLQKEVQHQKQVCESEYPS